MKALNSTTTSDTPADLELHCEFCGHTDQNFACSPHPFSLQFAQAAIQVALAEAGKRIDADVQPYVVALDGERLLRSQRRVVHVDICYSSKGYCALYGVQLHFNDDEPAGPAELYQD